MESLGPLADFGLAGAVILALFYTLKSLLTLGLEKFDQITERFTEVHSRIQADHKDERTEWRQSQEKRDERLDTTIMNLTRAIEEQNKRHRHSDPH